MTARFFHDQRPGVLDARFLAASMRTKYGIRPRSSGEVNPGPSTASRTTTAAATPEASLVFRAEGLATTVLAAQKMSGRLGCGDVRSGAVADEFLADCSDHKVVISCSGSECHPVRATH